MSEKSSQVRFMSALAEANFLLRQMAGHRTGKKALMILYMKLPQWTHNRVKDVFYAKPNIKRRIKFSGDELEYVRKSARVAECEARAADPVIAEMRNAFAILAARMQKIDPEFFDPQINQFLQTTLEGRNAPDGLGGNSTRVDKVEDEA